MAPVADAGAPGAGREARSHSAIRRTYQRNWFKGIGTRTEVTLTARRRAHRPMSVPVRRRTKVSGTVVHEPHVDRADAPNLLIHPVAFARTFCVGVALDRSYLAV